ncbi:MAG TPA: S9 family peptidase [Verrucomicrobiae bacterium]|jgi:dipeptidyl aminopeptidase/acylaminoacyl peptidase|nr:S9 family peptidase [Verrucomicrobiae bacterium]
MTRAVRQILLLVFAIVLSIPCVLAQSAGHASKKAAHADSEVIATLFRVRTFEQVTISPDGKMLAWVENSPGGGPTIYLSATKPGAVARPLGPGAGDSSLAWSPDSKSLAFLSDKAKTGQMQLYVISASGGPARQVTNVNGFLSAPGWSPDGKTIAVLLTENATRASGPLVAEAAQTGVIQESVTEQRLALVDAAGGKVRQISPADMYVYEYDWSPDSQQLVATAAHGNGDDNWYIAQIYTIAAAGSEMKSIYSPPTDTQIANPAWSPDGKLVAFIGGLMSDEGSVGGDIFVIPATGGEAKNVTPRMKASASWLTWWGGPTSGQKILFGEDIDGGSGLATVDANTKQIQTLYQTGDQISTLGHLPAVSLAADGKTSAILSESLSHAPEVWAGPIGNWQQITSRNAGLKPAWGEAKSIHWTNEGFNCQGWLLYPGDFDPAKKYPMVVQVHGGPGSMAHSSFPGPQSFGVALASTGYFVFMPNPRGSFGFGEAFTRANVKDFGYGDFRDIMAGVDQALKEAPIDEHRLGITGWSYGGYMTMWAVTQTNRFKTAVAGAGLANFQSYYGENQIDKWLVPFFGATVYDDPEVYAKSSPITFIKKTRTPTLVLVGDSDGECPTPQSYEFWHALKTLGVETELVVYEHEGHRFAKPAHLKDRIERVAAWFDQRLK